jgi:hypothetical protein
MGFLDRLFGQSPRGKAKAPAKPTSPMSKATGTRTWEGTVVDLRSEDEEEMASRSLAEHQRVAEKLGTSTLIFELIGLVKKDNSGFANKGRICEIGEALNAKGGFKLMQEAYYHVRSTGIYFSQDIWDGIGEWQA